MPLKRLQEAVQAGKKILETIQGEAIAEKKALLKQRLLQVAGISLAAEDPNEGGADGDEEEYRDRDEEQIGFLRDRMNRINIQLIIKNKKKFALMAMLAHGRMQIDPAQVEEILSELPAEEHAQFKSELAEALGVSSYPELLKQGVDLELDAGKQDMSQQASREHVAKELDVLSKDLRDGTRDGLIDGVRDARTGQMLNEAEIDEVKKSSKTPNALEPETDRRR